MRKLQGEEGEKLEKQSATLFTEDETATDESAHATDESAHDDIFITQISPINDDQFKSQNICSDVNPSCTKPFGTHTLYQGGTNRPPSSYLKNCCPHEPEFCRVLETPLKVLEMLKLFT